MPPRRSASTAAAFLVDASRVPAVQWGVCDVCGGLYSEEAVAQHVADAHPGSYPKSNFLGGKGGEPDPALAGQAAIVCPHCQTAGQVSTMRVKLKKGISGGKATAAVFTGGLSLLGTGLSRRSWSTSGSVRSLPAGLALLAWRPPRARPFALRGAFVFGHDLPCSAVGVGESAEALSLGGMVAQRDRASPDTRYYSARIRVTLWRSLFHGFRPSLLRLGCANRCIGRDSTAWSFSQTRLYRFIAVWVSGCFAMLVGVVFLASGIAASVS